MRVISWNINSVRARTHRLVELLKRHKPDVLCLQETKVSDKDGFPIMQVGSVGYRAFLHGQGGHNGVAILVRDPARKRDLSSFNSDSCPAVNGAQVKDVLRGFPGDPAPQEARVISACVGGMRIVNLYVVNGQSMDSRQFALKERWMDSLGKWVRGLSPPLMVIGDFNVCPDDRDVWDAEGLRDRIHCTKEERAWLKDLQGEMLDLVRLTNDGQFYTWWPYQSGAFERDEGLRFDGALGDDSIAKLVRKVWIDKEERGPGGDEKPSDHAPLIIDLDEARKDKA
jgi:exodeoxyribonuclease III